MTDELWQQILLEADKDGDGKIGFEEFEGAMKEMFRKSWLRKCDRSPSKSSSPGVCSHRGMSLSPVKFCENPEESSPTKIRKNNGEIISPERGNPFRNMSPSP